MARQINPDTERIRAAHAQRVEAVRSRTDLTPAGRNARLAKSFIGARDQLAALRQGGRDDRTASQTDLERRLFGSSSLPGDRATAAVSFRDAQDRCATLKTSTEASALLQRSERSGDEALSRAVAAEAYGRLDDPLSGSAGWVDVLDAYAATRPAARQALDNLISLATGADSSTADALNYMVLPPAELAGLAPDQVQSLAAQHGSTDMAPAAPTSWRWPAA